MPIVVTRQGRAQSLVQKSSFRWSSVCQSLGRPLSGRRSSVRRSHLWSSGALMATVALVGCAGQAPGAGYNNGVPTLLGGSAGGAQVNAAGGPSVGKSGGNVALLLPLTGNL